MRSSEYQENIIRCAQVNINKIKKEEKIYNMTFLALTKIIKKRKRFTKRRKTFLVIMERIKN
jgi:predicted ATP-dependent protease